MNLMVIVFVIVMTAVAPNILGIANIVLVVNKVACIYIQFSTEKFIMTS